MAKKKTKTNLVRGSKYSVKSLSTRDEILTTKGDFLGYVTLGKTHGIKIRLDDFHGDDKGSIRIIPIHVITMIDVIEEAESEEEDKETSSYFG
ncbi:MAG: hypothetical protein ACOC85_00960 [Thermoplasmatota archaeon]